MIHAANQSAGVGNIADYKMFSSDSHVSEPPDLWTERMDKSLRFRALRIMALEWGDKVEDFLIYKDFPRTPCLSGWPQRRARATRPSTE